jgi:hypothetical protein
MVSPINYRTDVLSPIEGYLQGLRFGEGLLTERQGRESVAQQMQEREQMMAMRQAQEGRTAQTFEMQRAAAAQQQAQAEQMQAQLMGLREMALEGTLTTEALDQFALANASTFDEFRTAFQNVSQPVRDANVQFGLQLSTSLLRGNTEAALSMLDTRIAAAENTGTPQSLEEAQRLRAIRGEAEIDPVGFATANLANLTAQGAIDSTTMKSVLEAVGQSGGATTAFQTTDQQLRAAGIVPQAEGGDGRYEQAMASGAGLGAGPTFRQATPEEAAVYGATAGQIDTATGRFFPIQPPTGMTLRTTPEGGVELVQGPGAGVSVGGRTSDYQYTTDADGRPVARPIAGTPAAAEVQGQRGRLEAAVGVGQNMLQTIESVVGRPAGDGQTGLPPAEALAGILGIIQGNLPPRTQAQADLLARVEQISGRAFLEAFETLKGGGQITEIEGQRATQAIARLQRTQSPEAFQEALFEFADIVRRGIERSRNELRVLPEVAPASNQQERPAAPAATGGRIRYDSQGNRIE